MKTNKKVLAGALALALGLGAFAPAFAEGETANTNKPGLSAVNDDYREAEKVLKERLDALNEAKANTAKKQEAKDAAQKAADDAAKALKDFVDEKTALETKATKYSNLATENLTKFNAQKEEDSNKAAISTAKITFDTAIPEVQTAKAAEDYKTAYKNAIDDFDKAVEGVLAKNTLKSEESVTELNNAAGALKTYVEIEVKLLDDYNNAKQLKLEEESSRANEALGVAQNELAAAERAQHAAQDRYDDAKDDFVNAGGDAETIAQYESRAIKSTETKTETTDEKVAKLKASLDELKISKASLEHIKALAPKYVEKKQAAYDGLVAKVDENIKTTEAAIKALQPKTALLFSTAYAAADAESVDVDQILKDNKKTNEEVDEFIKGLNDEADSSEEKPAEEKPAEEKPSEEKPAEEKPSEEKPAEEKPAEDNKATVKPAAKVKANPKTGVASVAGVAAVLAAASAAYVDSKRK